MGHYKTGKKTEILSFSTIKKAVLKAFLSIEEEAFFWILYYCGVRKSEAYERVAEDFVVRDGHLVIDFHERKKHGALVPPLELPLRWYGVDKIVKVVETARGRRAFTKSVYVYVDKKRIRQLLRDRWVFRHIQSTKAWAIVKAMLGPGYYAHFLRLNRLSEIGQDPSASLVRLKSFSGIKSTSTLDSYLGTSKKEQQKAMQFMEEKMKE